MIRVVDEKKILIFDDRGQKKIIHIPSIHLYPFFPCSSLSLKLNNKTNLDPYPVFL